MIAHLWKVRIQCITKTEFAEYIDEITEVFNSEVKPTYNQIYDWAEMKDLKVSSVVEITNLIVHRL